MGEALETTESTKTRLNDRKNLSSDVSEINSSEAETDRMESVEDHETGKVAEPNKQDTNGKLSGEEEDEGEQAEEESDMDEDQEGEAEEEQDRHKNEQDEEKERLRLAALEQMKSIEIDFALLKDKLYETQMNKLMFELELCNSNKHPDYLNYQNMIENNFQAKVSRFVNLQKYKLKCLDTQTRATRVAIHQQFAKLCQDLKSEEIMQITSDWYEINNERRAMDNITLNLPDYYQYNSGITAQTVNSQSSINQLVVQRNALYNELSSLKGIERYTGGFPSSLNDLKSCTNEEIQMDLKEMNLV
ncbi:hypothetical protein OGAPHI_005489 [Ogataea philodendri]|uniref:Transcriptional regulatory protein DEP1 n=1 Tax=Ogataea philodendri TaxID=1378263 RepID=A0A9P8T212_9ASCO|nr:uncharacterized protein OGAPHI_005489 [Ogataea philodendri]KAH3662241.1 hypothetical protein OGAPHI_005489 [Ogataea philodendri]